MALGNQSTHEDLTTWWTDLAELLRNEAEESEDFGYAAGRLVEAARVYIEELEDLPRGIELLKGGLAYGGGSLGALEYLCSLPEELVSAGERQHWLRSYADLLTDRAEKCRILMLLAESLGTDGEQADELSKVLCEVLDHLPEHAEALSRLASSSATGGAEALAELLQRQIQAEHDVQTEAQLWERLGYLYEAYLGRPDLAFHAFGEAQSLDPESIVPVYGAYRILLDGGDLQAAGKILRGAIGMAPVEVERHLHRLTNMYLGADGVALDQQSGATPKVYESGVLGAFEAYRQGVQAEFHGDIRTADRLYLQARRHPTVPGIEEFGRLTCALGLAKVADLADSMTRLATGIKDVRLLMSFLIHAGRVLEIRFGSDDLALDFYRRAVDVQENAVSPESLESIGGAEDYLRLLKKSASAEGYDAALGKLLANARSVELKARLLDRRAELSLVDSQNGENAPNLYATALRLDPENIHAHRICQLDLWRRRSWLPLLRALQSELPVATGQRRLELLDEIAQTHLRLGSPKGAEDAWREALTLGENWFPAQIGLGQLLDTQGRWRELSDLVLDELTLTEVDAPARVALLGRLAEIYEFNLDEHRLAADTYDEVLKLKPGAPDAIGGLERVLSQIGEPARLTALLSEHVNGVEDASERASLHVRIADLCQQQLGDPEQAEFHYRQALSERPGWRPAIWSLEWHLAEAGDYQGLYDLYATEVGRLEEVSDVETHKLAMLQPPTEAIGTWTQIVESGPTHLYAAWSVMRLRAEAGDSRGVTAAATVLAGLTEQRRDRAGFLREAAELAQPELDWDRRRALWTRLTELERDNPRPWQALQAQYLFSGNREGRITFLDSLGSALSDPSSRSSCLWGQGLLLESLGRPEDAVSAFRSAHQACATDPIPLWLLIDRRAFLDSAEQAELMRRLALVTSSKAAASRLLTGAAQLKLAQLGDFEGALRNARAAVRLMPGNNAAADQLERALISLGRVSEVVASHRDRLSNITLPEEQAECLSRIALVEQRLENDPEAAKRSLARALVLNGSDTALRLRLAILERDSGRGAAAIPLLETIIVESQDDDVLASAYLELGKSRLQEGVDFDEAVDDFLRAVALKPSEGSYEGLAEAHLREGQAELAQMAFKNMERFATTKAASFLAQLGQVEALIKAGRPSEAQRRLARSEGGWEPDHRCIDRAAHLLTVRTKIPTELRELLTRIVGLEPVVTATATHLSTPSRVGPSEAVFAAHLTPAVRAGRAEEASIAPAGEQAAQPTRPREGGEQYPKDSGGTGSSLGSAQLDVDFPGDNAVVEIEGSEVVEHGSSSVDEPLYEIFSSEDRTGSGIAPSVSGNSPTALTIASQDGISGLDGTGVDLHALEFDGTLADPVMWRRLAETQAEDPVVAGWLESVYLWLEGSITVDATAITPRPLTDAEKVRIVPDGLDPDLLTIIGHVIRYGDMPVVDVASRAEMAAEGWPIDDGVAFGTQAKTMASQLGIGTVMVVQNEAHPYTVDLFRREAPILTFGTQLLGAMDGDRGSFLIASTLVPLLEGMPPLSHTPCGQGFHEGGLDELLNAIAHEFGVKGDHENHGETGAELSQHAKRLVKQARSRMPDSVLQTVEGLSRKHLGGLESEEVARTRFLLDHYSARIALLYCNSFGGAMDMLRQLDFDDRPRGTLSNTERAMIIRDNVQVRQLLGFAATAACMDIRKALAVVEPG